METREKAFWFDFKSNFLKQKRNKQLYKYWLESVDPLKIKRTNTGLEMVLQAPSDLHKKWLQENLLQDFSNYIQQFYKEDCQIQFKVSPSLPFQKKPTKNPAFNPKQKLFFNPIYTFENFIAGKNNHLAYGASLAVTKSANGQNFNPLFIYGPSGLGKTHLLNAIGQKTLQNYPQKKVIYLSAERFLNEYISALQNKQTDQFRKKFRKNCQLLLIDDIQIIAKGRSVQEEFFHTFNDLYSQKAQIVICCDQPPSATPFLEDRIKTRLEGGLMVDISYPDEETRLAILKNKIKQKGLLLSQQSLEQISKVCKRSIREMEGVLNKIKIMAELGEGHLPLKGIENILKTFKKELTTEEIQKRTARAFNLSLEELNSPSRKKHIVKARQTAMFLIRKNLKKSLNDISLNFGKKDHTTVLNSIKKVEKLKLEDSDFKKVLESLQKDIHNNY